MNLKLPSCPCQTQANDVGYMFTTDRHVQASYMIAMELSGQIGKRFRKRFNSVFLETRFRKRCQALPEALSSAFGSASKKKNFASASLEFQIIQNRCDLLYTSASTPFSHNFIISFTDENGPSLSKKSWYVDRIKADNNGNKKKP